MANQNVTQLTQQSGSADTSSLLYAVTGGATDTGLPLSVFVNNLGLTGTPTAPTASTATSTTQIASTAFVHNVAGSYAPLAGGTFTGQVNISYSGGALFINDTSGTSHADLYFQSNGTQAWGIRNLETANTFQINRYVAGTLTDTPISVSNTTGVVSMPDGVVIGGGTINSTSVGATTPSTGKFTTLTATSTFTPSTTSGIVGTTLGDNANAGSVGEFISSSIPVGSAVALTSNTSANITSISLTAGDWDVWGTVVTNPAGTTTTSSFTGAISTTSAAFPVAPNGGASVSLPISAGAGIVLEAPVGTTRINVSSTTTVYLVLSVTFAVSTCGGYGFIGARRRR